MNLKKLDQNTQLRLYSSCLNDVCIANGDSKVKCANLKLFNDACVAALGATSNWRNATNCCNKIFSLTGIIHINW